MLKNDTYSPIPYVIFTLFVLLSISVFPVQAQTLREPVGIAVEADGSLVVTDRFIGAVVRVDATTGSQSVVSGCTAVDNSGFRCNGEVIGTGPNFILPESIAVEAHGSLVVADSFLGAVVRVDPIVGTRTVVSGCTEVDITTASCVGDFIGSGPAWAVPEDVAIEANGTLVVVDSLLGAVVRVDPITGTRTIVSGCPRVHDLEFLCLEELIGAGPEFFLPQDIAIEADGSLVVLDTDTRLQNAGRVLRVDPITGDRFIVSDIDVGNGPIPLFPQDIAAEPGGSFLVTDPSADVTEPFTDRILRVAPVTGDRVVVSGCCVGDIIGNGSVTAFPWGIVIEANGALVVTDPLLAAVVRLNVSSQAGSSKP